MTKFKPEVAYRILKERQDRLYEDAATLWNSADYVEYLNWREFMSSLSGAVLMEDVLDYLRTRIEEEQHDAV